MAQSQAGANTQESQWRGHLQRNGVLDDAKVGGNANELDRLAVEAEKLMQAWADYLDNLRKGADVVPLRVA
jgi:hypothetical protein